MGFGREGAICEFIEIMQIPPRFERRFAAYKSIAGVLQYPPAARREMRICKARPAFAPQLGDRFRLIWRTACVELRPSRRQDGS
jgi:hypothetical protein